MTPSFPLHFKSLRSVFERFWVTWCSSKGIVTITQPTIYIAIVTQEPNMVKCFKELITRAFLINKGWKQKNSYTTPKIPSPMITANDMCDQTIHAAICNAVQPSLPEKKQCTMSLHCVGWNRCCMKTSPHMPGGSSTSNLLEPSRTTSSQR